MLVPPFCPVGFLVPVFDIFQDLSILYPKCIAAT